MKNAPESRERFLDPTGRHALGKSIPRHLSDRVGRVRYFVYILGALTCCGLLLILIYIAAYLLPAGLGRLVSVTSYIMIKNVIFPLVVFVMSIRRLHDFDLSGWWSLLVLIPLVPIALVFIPGKKEANRFGPVPAPNPMRLKLAAVALPCALVGLYYYMLDINPKARSVQTPTVGTRPALRNYDAK
jgi:uncharacterized membrane protein YhaH (DUF805 family)